MKTKLATEETVTAPSKADEIAILREAARLLGPLSYCGPWLSQQISGIEADIRSDFFPQIDLEATKRTCGEMLTRAHDEAEAIKLSAEREAKARRTEANKRADEIREELARAIYRAQHAINS